MLFTQAATNWSKRQVGICVFGVFSVTLLFVGYEAPPEVYTQPGHVSAVVMETGSTHFKPPPRSLLQQQEQLHLSSDIADALSSLPVIATLNQPSNFTGFVVCRITTNWARSKSERLQDVYRTFTLGPVKVLIVTYMRSGSTFAGEFFNQNPEAFYWFEPGDGVFSHLYGSTLGVFPIDVTQQTNGSDRLAPEFESRAFSSALQNILNCDVSALPLEVTTHDFLHMRMRTTAPAFASCFDREQKRLEKAKLPGKIHNCKQFINGLCGKRGFPAWGECHRLLNCDIEEEFNLQLLKMKEYIKDHPRITSLHVQNLTHDQFRSVLRKTDPSALSAMFPLTSSIVDSVLNHHSCVGEFRDVFSKCSSSLTDACSNASIRVAKTIRVTMATIADIIQQDPSVRVLHLLRDPRAVVHSRLKAGIMSLYAQRRSKDKDTRLVDEAQVLCHKMLKDIQLRHVLQQKYPLNFKEIRYEQIALNPVQSYRDIYTFLGLNVSQHVETWIDQNTHATKSNSAFGTSRQNSTETAFRWETDVTYRTVKLMTEHCRQVLGYLGFATEL